MSASGNSRLASPGELQRLSDVDGHAWVGPRFANGEAYQDDNDGLRRLADLKPLEYDRVRKDEADRLGVRTETLDREVARLRGGASGPDDGTVLSEPEPWAYAVDGAGLLDLLAGTVRKHVVLPPMAAEAVALWIFHAHGIDAFSISPLLAVTSPTPECGKTTLLTLLGALVPRPLLASNITGAALFRAVEKWRPTLVIDEADTFLKDSDELRGIVNSGHNRTNAFVIRTVGENHDPKRFSTWAAKAVALIGKLPATLDSRSIHVELRRLAAGETVEPLRGDRLQHLDPLRRMAWRWAQDHVAALAATDPAMPVGLRGRSADNWRPLIAIADLAGGDWPEKARRAAETLCAGRAEQSAGIMLLDDIRAQFCERACERLTSAEIVEALAKMEDRPWAEWKGGKPLSVNQLAGLLRPFKIDPKKLRISGRTPGTRGYDLSWFDDAFTRYLPDVASQTATPPQFSESGVSRGFEPPRSDESVAAHVEPQAAENLDCGGVADRNLEQEEETTGIANLSDDDGDFLRELTGE